MTGEAALLLAEIGAPRLALLAGVAFVAATVSGMSGVGGGLLLAIFIAPVVGVKAVVPTVGVAALIAHVVRVWVYRDAIVWRPALTMLAGGVPATVASARLYVDLPATSSRRSSGCFCSPRCRRAGSWPGAICASARARSA